MAVNPDTAANLAHEIFDLQRAVRSVLTASIRGKETGVAIQFVLRLVGEGESRASQLAERLGIGAPILSRHIADLEEQGYVVRRKDPCDGRAQLVALTSSGAERLRHIEEQRTAVLQGHLAHWGDEDLCKTVRVLRRLTESLTKPAPGKASGAVESQSKAC